MKVVNSTKEEFTIQMTPTEFEELRFALDTLARNKKEYIEMYQLKFQTLYAKIYEAMGNYIPPEFR
jgi:hypothetical protein